MDLYMGQILPVAFQYAPKNTAYTAGQIIQISQNQALFALLGTNFGGNGSTTFALPNTQGRTMIGFGTGGSVMPLGATGGEVSHTLVVGEMPQHIHTVSASTLGDATDTPDNALPGTAGVAAYGPAPSSPVPLGAAPLSTAGSGQPHPNMQPSLPINFAIVLFGIFPSRP